LVAESDADEDAVGGPGDEDYRHPTEEGGAERRSPWLVAGSVEKVVASAVAHDSAFEEGPRVQRGEDDPGEEHAAEERIRDPGVVQEVDLQRRHQSQGADKPAEIPIRLSAVGTEPGLVWPPLPDRVDLDQAAE